jgi:hypothetical protein
LRQNGRKVSFYLGDFTGESCIDEKVGLDCDFVCSSRRFFFTVSYSFPYVLGWGAFSADGSQECFGRCSRCFQRQTWIPLHSLVGDRKKHGWGVDAAVREDGTKRIKSLALCRPSENKAIGSGSNKEKTPSVSAGDKTADPGKGKSRFIESPFD